MTTTMADFEVEEDLDGDRGGRYRARVPDRLRPRAGTVVVRHLPWADAGAWEELRVLLGAIRAAATGEPHLVEVVEAGYLDGTGAWVVTSDPGRARLSDGRVEPRAALGALAGAAAAVHALHEAGVVHQGVSPEAVTPDGVVDLPVLDRSRTVEGHVLEVLSPPSLDTVDPAWARGGRPGRETDLFALGATLYRAVTGRLLHPDLATDQPVVALQRVMFEPVHLPPDLDPDVAATVAACIATDPADRPPSALALSHHLSTLAGHS